MIWPSAQGNTFRYFFLVHLVTAKVWIHAPNRVQRRAATSWITLTYFPLFSMRMIWGYVKKKKKKILLSSSFSPTLSFLLHGSGRLPLREPLFMACWHEGRSVPAHILLKIFISTTKGPWSVLCNLPPDGLITDWVSDRIRGAGIVPGPGIWQMTVWDSLHQINIARRDD